MTHRIYASVARARAALLAAFDQPARRAAMMRWARPVVAGALVATLAVSNLPTQRGYLRATAAGAGAATMIESLQDLRRLAPGRPILVDVTNPSYPRIIALYTRGHPTMVIAANPYLGIEEFMALMRPGSLDAQMGALLPRGGRAIVVAMPPERQFPLPSSDLAELEFRRFGIPGIALDGAVLIAPAADQSVVNDSAVRPATGRYYARDLAEVRNYLALIDSSLGHVLVPGVTENVSLWPYEADFGNPGHGMQGIGRYLLFQVLNPIDGSRLLLDLTITRYAPLGRALPEAAAVIGQERVALDFVGRGAARVLSEPVVARVIDGRSYIAIDMGPDVSRTPPGRRGVAALYNRDLSLDPRRLSGWARNISLLSEEQVRAMTPPAAVSSFPHGLFAPGLLFSGVYEDGWMAEVARFRLQMPAGSRGVRIAGNVQGFGELHAGVGITVLVDGEPVVQRRLDPGAFDLRAALSPSGAARWIEIRADVTERQPGGGDRMASVQLRSVELEATP